MIHNYYIEKKYPNYADEFYRKATDLDSWNNVNAFNGMSNKSSYSNKDKMTPTRKR